MHAAKSADSQLSGLSQTSNRNKNDEQKLKTTSAQQQLRWATVWPQ